MEATVLSQWNCEIYWSVFSQAYIKLSLLIVIRGHRSYFKTYIKFSLSLVIMGHKKKNLKQIFGNVYWPYILADCHE